MNLISRAWSLLAVGECTTPHGRTLVSEQFRILTNQIPILYAVILLDAISVGFVLPPSVDPWLRFALPGMLLTVSVVRMIQWIRMRGVELAPEEAYRFLSRMRILSAALPAGFLIWILALIEAVDPALRAPIALLIFMGCIGSAYCLGIFPAASRLCLFIAGLPLVMRLLASGEPLLVCIGINLGLLLVLFVRMIDTNFGNFVRLIETQARVAEEAERARAAHTYLTEALDVVPEGLAIFDKDDRLVLWNRQYPRLYASNATAIVHGARFEDILRAGLKHQQYADAVGREAEWFRERMARHTMPQSSHEQQLPGDKWARIEERRTADGGSIGVRIDITDLKRSEASFRLLFEENPLPMWVADAATRRLLAVNAAMCRHYGYAREELLSMSERDLDAYGNSLAARSPQDPVIHKTSRGDRIEVLIESRPLPYQGRAGLVSVAFDVTERNRAEQQVRYLASHDLLTDLPNRAAFDTRLATLMQHSAEAGDSFAVLCIDLDRFKEVNDLFGHSTGDAVLREAGRRLRQAGQDAYIARVGGDEFIAITEQVPLPGTAELVASRIREALKHPIEVDGRALDIDLSIGVALYPRDGDNAASLLANADAALYRAKKEGRGVTRIFTRAMDRQLRDRRAMEHDLRSAVENNELSLEFQPQRHRDGKICGFEALVRWQHPERGLVTPGEFIPVAENSGAIAKIDEWVLMEACRQAASWDDAVRIAVNVSAAQFRRENLEHQVCRALRESGLSPSRLELEITEGVLIEDISRASQTLKSLKSLGVMIALDDFGTGYSSLSYLQAFPLDRIKIDRSFVAALGASARSLSIVRAVIGLAHGLNVPVLAEGVETNEQLAILMRERCDDMQGYLIGRPHKAELYAEHMKADGGSRLKTAI
ncbi:putative bifunctional diguanylate cyclase/phosphodiesterase [Bradyrhizobium sp. BWA-3-5]|uniref:putative bifunctional diguanylate cyclase/phosphodiesterase n=1 Tax=Bradyrhizobium sp. BWA-3-5 TaxID=3080013 RepID=UPI00293E43BF|nr:EAL domain-containing protein [Bradyrhizobium sp. BWA-3-5]WOH64437.1 EAL domain-containing protein [Bradyrhizobium sp. BWA-3-5]